MAVIANRRSVMTFFSDPECPHSHRCRIVLSQRHILARPQTVFSNPDKSLVDANRKYVTRKERF